MGEKILVVGGVGYIGSHVTAELVEHGYDVVVVDDLSTGHWEAVKGATFHCVSTLDWQLMRKLFKGYKFDAVMDLAAYSLVGDSVKRPLKYYRNNVEGARTLLETAIAHGVDKFIYSSSAAVYGGLTGKQINESDPVAPENPYGATKLAVEEMLRFCGQANGIRYVSLRYFNAAGAWPEKGLGEDHSPESHLIPRVIETALGRRPYISVYGSDYPTPDGTAIRDYVHVRDIAAGHLLALRYLLNHGASRVVNLGSGAGYSVKEIIQTTEKVLADLGGANAPRRRITVKYEDRRPGDPPALVADIRTAKGLLGWEPKRNLEDIISSAYLWHRDHPNGYKERSWIGNE